MKATSWKTTLFGCLAAICTALSGVFPEAKELLIACAAVFAALLGIFAKDSNVTGGTKSNGQKIIPIMILLMALPLAGFSQDNHWKGFFKPVDNNLITLKRDLGQPASVWLFRPAVELTALQLTYNKDLKQFESSSLTSGGIGIGYQHFIEVNGAPFNNFGFNALLLFGVTTSTDPASLSLAGTISALKFINIGAGYDFSGKKIFLLTGVTYNFN
jgi:hypothetical protein